MRASLPLKHEFKIARFHQFRRLVLHLLALVRMRNQTGVRFNGCRYCRCHSNACYRAGHDRPVRLSACCLSNETACRLETYDFFHQ